MYALSPEEAMTEYSDRKNRSRSNRKPDPDRLQKIISSMDDRGAWVEEISFPYYIDALNRPARKVPGITTRTYIRNMKILIGAVKNGE